MTTTTTTAPTRTRTAVTRRQRIGLVLGALFSLANLPSVLFTTPEGEVGPPLAILVADSLLGLVGLVAAVVAWRSGSRAAMRVLAGAVILLTLSALPAFFVDVPSGVKLISGVATLLGVATAMLLLSSTPSSDEIAD